MLHKHSDQISFFVNHTCSIELLIETLDAVLDNLLVIRLGVVSHYVSEFLMQQDCDVESALLKRGHEHAGIELKLHSLIKQISQQLYFSHHQKLLV